MARTTQNSGKVQRRTALWFIALMGLLAPAVPAAAAPPEDLEIVLPGATSAEGIAAGEGTTFYAGDLGTGDIFRGDIRTGEAKLFIDAPNDGRAAVGMKADTRNDLLFVAGGATGKAFIYDTESGKPVKTVELAPGFINDVTLTPDGAWFTNSAAAELYFIPVSRSGVVGEVHKPFLKLTGPAADASDPFNLNGIASAQGGKMLIVAHSGNGELYTVNPETGASALRGGVSVPNVDGILVRGHQLWAVQNFKNQVSHIRLSGDLSSGRVLDVITSEDFNIPSTAALFGNTLGVVNAQFMDVKDKDFEVVLVRARN
jgi:sugar lactone lactonase YvrE